MPTSVYVETSIVSYLTARQSGNAITQVRQESTRRWWAARRSAFELLISQVVLDEAAAGDAEAAAKRLEFLAGLPLLDVTQTAVDLARSIQQLAHIPERAAADALHIALCAAHGVDYLMTWNMRHIANAELRPGIETACRRSGFASPIICTPDELMGT